MSSNSTHCSNASQSDYETRINDVVLPEQVVDLVEEYEAVVGDRDRFVWKWIYSLFPAFTLSSVPREKAGTARIQKTILTIFITLLDDIAEKHRDEKTFEEIRRLIIRREAEDFDRAGDQEVVDFACRLWSAYEARLIDAPRYEEVDEIFDYDLRQAVNAIDYSRIINDRLLMANLNGTEHYTPHNMIMFPYADVDIMYSPSFDFADLGILRDLIWDLQKMARIGNWLTTWEREIHEGDFTAGIIVYALRNDIVTYDELDETRPEHRGHLVDRIKESGVEDRFMEEWWCRYRAVTERKIEAESVDLDAFITGMEIVMEHHLASQGYK